MIEGFGKKHAHRHVKEIPLAPVLDLLTVVVFFLILSTSFTEYTKQTLPPSATSTISSPVAPPPVSPKFFALHKAKGYRLFVKWSGDKPGQAEKMVPILREENPQVEALRATAAELVKDFKKQYATESSIQMGLGPNVTYQEMVSLMDGVRESLQDVVLISSAEAVAIDNGTSQ